MQTHSNAKACDFLVRWDEAQKLWCVQTDMGDPIGWSDSQAAAIIMAARTASHDHGNGFRSHVCIEDRNGYMIA